MIEVKDLTFKYDNGREVLKHIDFTVNEGESVGIIGANGAGKSTLLKLFVGLLQNQQGEIKIDGVVVEKKNYAQIRKKAGYVFQDSENQLFMSTVYEDVAFGPRNYGMSREETDARVMSALRQVRIEELRDRQIYRMSGGQKKLAAIATILAMTPDIIMLDEPSVALDPRNRRNLISVLNEIKGTKIVASHDLDMIMQVCERTIFICRGEMVFDGPTKEILTDKAKLEEYGL